MVGLSTPPEDLDPRTNRRKACDLCYTKKIKCDMLRPVCSNCKLYHTDCHTTAVRRKPNVSRARQAARAQNEEILAEPLEARLARIERQLQQVLEAAKKPEPKRTVGDATDVMMEQEWRFDPVEPSIYRGPQPDTLSLPPLEDILPVVDFYFGTYNMLIPLFDQPSFMRMLQGWYTQRGPRDGVTWAAINIVLAIGYRTPAPDATESTQLQIQQANDCLRNAQSVVSELVTRDEDLLGLQILLGIVMLFQNSRDAKPAGVIIGTAMRLAHRLQLHVKEAEAQFNAWEVERRSRVFWIAYTLDKDISLRAKTPSAQSDDDIDVQLPTLTPSDGAGLVWTRDGQTCFNYHRMRVELGHIQGKVYSLLYSNRASKVRGSARHQRVVYLQTLLDRWYARVPVAFRVEHVADTATRTHLLVLTKLHHAYLLATVMTQGIYGHDAEWTKRISSFGHAVGANGEGAGAEAEQPPPLPEGWARCVALSRGCMRLFQAVFPTECLVWQCQCAHFSALVILLHDMRINPGHELVAVDLRLAATAMHLFDRLLEVTNSASSRALRRVVGKLHDEARAAVEATRAEEVPPLNESVLDFLPLEWEEHGFVDNDGVFDAGPFGETLPTLDFTFLDDASNTLGTA